MRMTAAFRPIDLDKMRKKFRVRKAGHASPSIWMVPLCARADRAARHGFFVCESSRTLGLPVDSDRNDRS